MSILKRKLRRDLFAAKGMLLAIVSIIALGTSNFVAMVCSYQNLTRAQQSYYADCFMADFWVNVKKVPIAELQRLKEIPGIDRLRPRIVFEATADIPGELKPVSGKIVSMPRQPSGEINGLTIRSGSYFSGRKGPEVILNEDFAEHHNLQPGDRLHLLLNNRRQELVVVGTAISAEFVYLLGPGGLVPDPSGYGIFYVQDDYAEDIFDFQEACNEIVGLLRRDSHVRVARVLEQIENELEPFGVLDTIPRERQTSNWFLTSEIEGLKVTATVLPSVFLGVAALILNVLMTRLVEQQRTVVGTLKALGYSNREVSLHYLGFGLAVGVAGGLLGIAAGIGLAELLTMVYREYYIFPQLINQPGPVPLLSGMAMSLLFALAGTIRGVRAVMRLSPAEAMRAKPPVRGRTILLEHWTWFWRKLDFRWHMVLRDLERNRMRTFVGIVSSSVGAALLVVSFVSWDSMNELVEFQYEKVLTSDFDLTFKEDQHYGAVLEAKRFPGVDEVEPLFVMPCKYRNGHYKKQGAIMGILPNARMTVPRDIDGNPVSVPTNGVMLSRKMADMLDVQAGHLLTIEPVRGDRRPRQIVVSRVIDSYLGMMAYADWAYLNHLFGEEGAISSLQLKVSPDPAETAAFYRTIKQLPAIQSVAAIREQKEQLSDVLIEQMLASLVVVIIFAGLIYLGSILNSSLISLAERKREIATFRVLGFTTQEVGSIFFRESLCVNVAGTLCGLPLGYLLSRGMISLYDTELFRLPMLLSWQSCAITVCLGVAFTGIAHLPVRRAIRKLDWLDALNVRE